MRKTNRKYPVEKVIFIFFILAFCGYIFSRFMVHKRPNVILITLDSLRPDHLGCYGYQRATSFNMDKVAEEGAIFSEAVAQGSHTSVSNPSLITSSYPNKHHVRYWGDSLPLGMPTLAEILRRHGYQTAFISDQYAISLIKGIERGFVTYNAISALSYEQRSKVIDITDWAIKWLKDNKGKKIFLWLYYLAPHGPYYLSSYYRNLFINDPLYYKANKVLGLGSNFFDQSGIGVIPRYLAEGSLRDVDYYLAQYDAQLRYTDDQIGRLIEELKKLKIYNDTLIIITSDHGESLGERNIYFCHGTSLYDELIRIPLLVKMKGFSPANSKIDAQVRSIDIAPTILDMLDISPPPSMQGVSLLPLLSGKTNRFDQVSFSEMGSRVCLRTKERKLIYDRDSHRYEFYNLLNDPLELNNMIDLNSPEIESLKSSLDEYLSDKDCLVPQDLKPDLDREEELKLRSLGYAQ